MKHYRKILAAIDLHPDADTSTITRAQSMAADNKAELYVVHAVETLSAYGAAYAYPSINDVENELSDEHREQCLKEAKQLKIDEDKLIIEKGAPNMVIVNAAKKIGADLIVVGAHTQHGLNLLLGSTTDSVLHNAPCDVLAIHLDDE